MEVISFIYITIFLLLTYAVVFYPVYKFKNKKNFSVIIPYRNEIDYIDKNYYFVKTQGYPQKKYEVIYVNDHSSDGTYEFIEDKGENNITNINLENKRKGKFSCIKKGFLNSKNEYLILTDCDSYGSKSYLEAINSSINPADVLYAGFFEIEGSKLFSLDTFFLVGVAAALNFFNLPSSCPGANICVKNDIYKRFLDKTKKSNNKLTEDALLINTVKSKKMGGINFIFKKDHILKTRGYSSIKDFFNQRMRWLKGGFNIDYRLLIFLIFNFISNILFVVNTEYIVIPFIMIFVFMTALMSKLDKINYMIYYPVYFFIYIVYTVLLGFMFLFSYRNINWKGREY